MEQKKGLQQDMQEKQETSGGQENQDGVKMLELKIRQDGSGMEEESGELSLSNETIEQIFDKVFKKILTLSGRAVVGLINGLFGTDYPPDSRITYNWTEFVDEKLKRRLADTILTVNERFSYHMEAQITNDRGIVFRMFDYGYGQSLRKREHDGDRYVLRFPKPVVIYLYYEGTVPDEYTLTLEFDEGKKTFEYTVPVVKLTELSVEELNRRKMVILIPFHLLKLKQWLKEGKVTEESLRKLVHDDIIGSINENQRLGNISTEDALKLKRYTGRLSRYLYQKLQGEGLGVLMEMTDESFMTDVDLFFEAYHAQEDALKEKDEALKEQEETLKEQEETLKEQEETLKEQKEALKEKEKAAVIKLIRQVCRNREKGKSPETIAEDLIEPVEVVKKICEIRDSMEEKCDPEEIFASVSAQLFLG